MAANDSMDTCTRFMWERVHATGDGTETDNRVGSTATIIGSYLWIIGGPTIGRKISRLDMRTQVWKQVKFEYANTYNLLLHTATLFSDGILIMGVRRVFAFTPRSVGSPELHVFDPLLNELRVVPTYGDRPGFKKSHTVDYYEERHMMILFAGLPLAKSVDAQLFFLDVASWRWTRPATRGEHPSLRSRHSSSLIGSTFFVYGGDSTSTNLYIMNLASKPLTWSAVRMPEAERVGRVGPVMCAIGGGRLIIYGGYTAGSNSSDLYLVENAPSESARTLCKLEPSLTLGLAYSVGGLVPPGRECPRAMMYHNKLLITGGNSRDQSDYFMLRPEQFAHGARGSQLEGERAERWESDLF